MPGFSWFRLGAILFALFVLGPALAVEEGQVLLATTTSTQDSGLLDDLLPVFEKKHHCRVKTIAAGSGQAIVLGQKGDVDVLLVHSPAAEEKFMAGGFGAKRTLVMYNDFILVGPGARRAELESTKSPVEALRSISTKQLLFLSRGDESGTHSKERQLWNDAGVKPEGHKWYQETGAGMGQTLRVASEKNGYTLTDRATFLALKKILDLRIVSEKASELRNVYHVISVNSVKFPRVNSRCGESLAGFFVSRETQALIGKFGISKFGEPLFFPAAGTQIQQ